LGPVLGIETSCDETSAAVVAGGRTILSNVVASQVELHRKYGGVVPEIASRDHLRTIIPVVREAICKAGLSLHDIAGIGVTFGPGLVGALLVGVAAAKGLAYALKVPLAGVNHLEGHIFANFLAHPELEPPFVALVVSGGHTSLVHVQGYEKLKLLGQTRDDAAGEVFDKVGRVMGLPYPAGPEIDRLAAAGDPEAVAFPRAMSGKDNRDTYEFSFSGLKSAVVNYLNNLRQRGEKVHIPDVAASFQAAVVDVLVSKTLAAAASLKADKVVLAGGVAANQGLRAEFARRTGSFPAILYPPPKLCTDNAAMIACRAYYQLQAGRADGLTLNAMPALKLTSRGEE